MSSFSVRTTGYENNVMLNICDVELVDKTIRDEKHNMHIGKYYQERIVDEGEARVLLEAAQMINMVGEHVVTLSLELNIGSESAIKHIDNIPFLLVFKT